MILGRAYRRLRSSVEDVWLGRVAPLELARKHHREAGHSRRRGRIIGKYIPTGGVGAEIGVFWGHFSEVLLHELKPTKLYLVDPWDRLHGKYFNFSSAYTLDGALTTAAVFERVSRIADKSDGVIELRKQYCEEFLDGIDDGTLDWIYVDATHDYPSVLGQLRAALPKLKPTGILFGDDYFEPSNARGGVRRAVNTFLEEADVELIVEELYQFILLQPGSPRLSTCGSDKR